MDESPQESGSEAGREKPEIHYELRVERALRGREEGTKATMHNAGWEFVSVKQGLVQSELTFRRVKPAPPPNPLLQAFTTFQGLQPRAKRNLLLTVGAVVGALSLVIAIAAVNAGDDTAKKPTAAHASKSTAKASTATTATAKPSATTAATTAAVTDISVDELIDRINTVATHAGDQFRVRGTLFQSDRWMTGATGDYDVYLKAKGGKSSLLVLTDESAAEKWQNGTQVEMVLENVKATASGDTHDGWMRAKSVKTISGGTSPEAKQAAARTKRLRAMKSHATSVNKESGARLVESIEPGAADNVIHVNLGTIFNSGTPLQAQGFIQQLNAELVDLATAADPDDSINLYYFLSGDEVAQNRSDLDPSEVKFKGVLDE